jgi:uncharacterized repeat protein (TIGR01451 family)
MRRRPLSVLKILFLFLSLFAAGCAQCLTVVSVPGVYLVGYLDSRGVAGAEVVTVGPSGVLVVDLCNKITGILLIEPADPEPEPPPNQAPVCTQAQPSVQTLPLDPTNFYEIGIQGVTDPENDPIRIRIQDIFQDEPTAGLFAGDLTPDALFGTDMTQLRAESNPAGNGRTYAIDFTAEDDDFAHCSGTVKVCVPTVLGGTCGDDGRLFDSMDRPSIDITAVMSDSPDPVVLGDNLTYTVTATNSHTLIAENVQVLYILPVGIDLVSAPANCDHVITAVRTLPCLIPALPPGSSDSVSIVVQPTQTGMVTSSAEVRPRPTNGMYSDPDSSNSTPEATTTVLATGADLSVTVTESTDTVAVNGILGYTVVATNNGPLAATNVVLTNQLSSVVETLGITISQGSCSSFGGAYTCNVGTLAAGASVTFTIGGQIIFPNPISMTATVTASESDPDPSNNTDTEATTVIGVEARQHLDMVLAVFSGLGVLTLVTRRNRQ